MSCTDHTGKHQGQEAERAEKCEPELLVGFPQEKEDRQGKQASRRLFSVISVGSEAKGLSLVAQYLASQPGDGRPGFSESSLWAQLSWVVGSHEFSSQPGEQISYWWKIQLGKLWGNLSPLCL